jgi:phosphohistidine phosphatase
VTGRTAEQKNSRAEDEKVIASLHHVPFSQHLLVCCSVGLLLRRTPLATPRPTRYPVRTMHLILFRHGIAEETGPDGSDDSRRLTPEGVQRTRQAAAGLTRVAKPPSVILTSPLVRARQTAQIVGEAFDLLPRELDELAHGPADAVIDRLRQRDEGVVLIVGHEPTLSRIIEQLCTGADHQSFVQMKKAGCACVQTQFDTPGTEGASKLLWLATAKMLRQIGDGQR